MVQGQAHAEEWVAMFPEQEYIFGDFIEHLWAYLTIQQLLSKQYDVFQFQSITIREFEYVNFFYDGAFVI